ncbi:hypothetical protein [Streptomyces sp. NPDC048636]|uniref:hypothetical protein n=1 Tax=Streptomyces sp. NPDC048636 TaxID=3155762 RepID=UPI00341D6A53
MRARWITTPITAAGLTTAAALMPPAASLGAGALGGIALWAAANSAPEKKIGRWRVALPLAGATALEAVTAFADPGLPTMLPAAAAWCGGTILLWPRRPKRSTTAPASTAPAETPVRVPQTFEAFLVSLWEEHIGVSIAPGTRLANIDHKGGTAFSAIIVGPAGQPVPKIDLRELAAALGVGQECLKLRPISGASPNLVRLICGPPAAQPTTLEEMWQLQAAGANGPAPNTIILDHKATDAGVRLMLERTDSEPISINTRRLATRLDVDDPTRIVVEADLTRAVVSLYDTHPLESVREATIEDLTVADDGTIAIGVAHDGTVIRIPLIDPTGGALHSFAAGCTGSGKSVLAYLVIAAERLSGIVSWVGDCQGGTSLPEVEGLVDRYATGVEGVVAMLLDLRQELRWRTAVMAQMKLGNIADAAIPPFPYLSVSIDEFNMIGRHPDQKIRNLAREIVEDVVSIGRKVGIGFRILGQSLLLKDLLDSNLIREQGRTGFAILLRVMSEMTKRKSLEGFVEDPSLVSNIRRDLGGTTIDDVFYGREKARISSAGMGYALSDNRAVLMRVFHTTAKRARALLSHGYTPVLGERPYPVTTVEALRTLLAPKGTAAARGDKAEEAKFAEDLHGEPLDQPETAGDDGRSIADAIVAVLAEEGEPMRRKDLIAAVASLLDCNHGSVDNGLKMLVDEGRLIKPGRGMYALPN